MSKNDGASWTVTILTRGVKWLSKAEIPELNEGLMSWVGFAFCFGTGMYLSTAWWRA